VPALQKVQAHTSGMRLLLEELMEATQSKSGTAKNLLLLAAKAPKTDAHYHALRRGCQSCPQP
jgi:hypothetical protein